MRLPVIAIALVAALATAGCGVKNVNATTYTCSEFNKSLRTKGDDTSGNYIRQLRKQANLGQSSQTENRELSLGVFLACRGKPGSTRPAPEAIATAKKIRAGTFKFPGGKAAAKKKSTK
jgi:hypothetical protein